MVPSELGGESHREATDDRTSRAVPFDERGGTAAPDYLWLRAW
jgi:hypothetical protein